METREEVIRGEIDRINAAIDETREQYGNQFTRRLTVSRTTTPKPC